MKKIINIILIIILTVGLVGCSDSKKGTDKLSGKTQEEHLKALNEDEKKFYDMLAVGFDETYVEVLVDSSDKKYVIRFVDPDLTSSRIKNQDYKNKFLPELEVIENTMISLDELKSFYGLEDYQIELHSYNGKKVLAVEDGKIVDSIVKKD